MKITRTIVTNVYTAHYESGAIEKITGKYSYAGARSILQKIHPDDGIHLIEITEESKKYEMPLDDFIKYANEVN